MQTTQPFRAGQILPAILLVLLAGPAASTAHAQLGISQITSNSTPTAGGPAFSYGLTVTGGALPATEVRLIDTLPPGAMFNGIGISGVSAGAFVCYGPATGANGPVMCTSSVFPAGGVAVVTIVAQYCPDATPGVRMNAVRVVAAGGAMSEVALAQTVQSDAALTLITTATAEVAAGDNVVYNLSVQNTGSSAALNVLLKDVLPDATSFVAATGTGSFHDGCSFSPATNQLTCWGKSVPNGTHEITLVVKTSARLISRTLTMTNSATLQAGVGAVAGSPASAITTVLAAQ